MKTMKIALLSIAGILLVAAVVAAPRLIGRGDSPSTLLPSSQTLGVLELVGMKNVVGRDLRVEGVVARVEQSAARFALSDTGECSTCSPETCDSPTLPVEWRGEQPAIGKRLIVTGRVADENGKLIFIASKLENAEAA